MDESPENEPPLDTPELRRRIRATLTKRLWLRFHVGALVGSTILVGLIASMVLRGYPSFQTALGVRYALSSVLAYAWFLLCVRWWVKYMAGIRPLAGSAEEDRGRFDMRAVRDHDEPGDSGGRKKPPDWGDGCLDPGGCFDFEGILVVGMFLVLFFSIFWVYSSGPAILIEAATDTLFAGGLLRWARRTEEAWVSRSVRNTLVPFAFATTSLFLLGLAAQYHCPGATRIGDVWTCLW